MGKLVENLGKKHQITVTIKLLLNSRFMYGNYSSVINVTVVGNGLTTQNLDNKNFKMYNIMLQKRLET